ncbi:MAG: thiol-disulfide oxidoreductase DCC family protein [Chthoniobacterales bacterium]
MTSSTQRAKSIIFYDSDCGVCSAFVGWLVGRAGGKIVPIAYQDESACSKYPGIDLGHADKGVQAIIAGGSEIRSDARAIAACLKETPGFAWIGVLIDLPVIRAFSQIGYRIFAANRRRISKIFGLQACKLPQRAAPNPHA